jgi:hypothetical protein
LLGLGRKQLGDLWVAVREEQPGIDQHVDAVAGRFQEAAPQRPGDGAAVGIEVTSSDALAAWVRRSSASSGHR